MSAEEKRRLMNCSVGEKDYAMLGALAEKNGSSRATELQRIVDAALAASAS